MELIAAMPAAAEVPVRKALGWAEGRRGGDADLPEAQQPEHEHWGGDQPRAAHADRREHQREADMLASLQGPVGVAAEQHHPTAPKTKGRAASRPVSKLLTPKTLTMVGRKKATP